jgi:hypothetical protein
LLAAEHGVTVSRHFVMTASEADFHRLLPLAFPGVTFDAVNRRFTAADGRWTLELSLPGRLALTSVLMATLDVTFRFEDADPDVVTARFLRYFMRGGG